MERCEWNPETDMPALSGGMGCQNEAQVSVGADGDWHLCKDCARRAIFRRYRVRVPLKGTVDVRNSPR